MGLRGGSPRASTSEAKFLFSCFLDRNFVYLFNHLPGSHNDYVALNSLSSGHNDDP